LSSPGLNPSTGKAYEYSNSANGSGSNIVDGAQWVWNYPHKIPGTPTATAVSSSEIDLTWSAVDLPGSGTNGLGAADGYYKICRCTDADGGSGHEPAPASRSAVTPNYSGLASAQTGGTISFADTGLTSGTKYYYKIYAYETGTLRSAAPR